MDAHKLSLSLKDHPEIQAALAGASAGDYVTIKELKICIDEIADDLMVGSVDGCGDITVKDGPSKNKGASDEASEEATAPVLSVMSPGYKGKKSR